MARENMMTDTTERKDALPAGPPAAGIAELAPPSSTWWQRHLSRLSRARTPAPGRPEIHQHSDQKQPLAHADIAQAATEIIATSDRAMRSTAQRLKASLRSGSEALSPRVLRRSLAELEGVADPKISEVEAGRRARGVAQWYAKATAHERRDLWLLMSEQFAPDAKRVQSARERYEAALQAGDEAGAELALWRGLVSPRRRLLQRFAAYPDGLRFLLDLRAELLPELRKDARLAPLDAELEALLATWFDIGFLELRRISWDSPASLLEKLIRYEAVHDIRSWSDLKNRLDSDRRCYGFFHPKLPDEPLIFVEIALWHEMVASIEPLLDESLAHADVRKATTAIFYSISNTQPGLKGVGFGDSLIKRVVETLRADFPRLKTFATLSPIPGFRSWLHKAQPLRYQAIEADGPEAHQEELSQWAAYYLTHGGADKQPVDAVARFHLGNGARVERINAGADPSAKGIKQSWGWMVNYLYDLKQLDAYRDQLTQGQIAASSEVKKLAKAAPIH
jgi:malonyl-CoA decarboxylase